MLVSISRHSETVSRARFQGQVYGSDPTAFREWKAAASSTQSGMAEKSSPITIPEIILRTLQTEIRRQEHQKFADDLNADKDMTFEGDPDYRILGIDH